MKRNKAVVTISFQPRNNEIHMYICDEKDKIDSKEASTMKTIFKGYD